MHLHGSANRRVTPCYTITQSFLNQPFHRMLSILRAYGDVDGDEFYTTRSSFGVYNRPGLILKVRNMSRSICLDIVSFSYVTDSWTLTLVDLCVEHHIKQLTGSST